MKTLGGLALEIPREKSRDSTLALLAQPYTFISSRCERYDSDIFETRLMLRQAICTIGEEAARMFYHPGRFTRRGALPPTTLMLLQDKGSVQTLDGQAHRHRKHMFMSLMSPESVQKLMDIAADQWHSRLAEWAGLDEIVLHFAVEEILCRAACQWAGVPLTEFQVKQRTEEFSAMIAGAGAVGPRNWKAMLLRMRSERWARDIITAIRDHELDVAEESAAHAVAWHRNPAGNLLDTKVAAVELINFLRPIVAVARFVTFAALALHQYPECRQKLRSGQNDYHEQFVHEVRRFYPFFPFIAGRAQDDFEWRGHLFGKGVWVILDIYGTNRDPRAWGDPEVFRPERFRDWDGSRFHFIPQGGGGHHEGHRCAGEGITIDLMKMAVNLLTTQMHYDVPEQDLRIRMSRAPAIPESRLVISNVRRA